MNRFSLNEDQKPEYILIESKEECMSVIEKIISTQRIIAIDCEGVNLSKNGQLTLIQIGLEGGMVYIFDILKGGIEFFTGDEGKNNGLKSLFENRSIAKLIHDCRNDWDSILHQYKTRIFNFIDTQEAYFIYDLFYQNEINLPISLSRFIQHFTKIEMKQKSELKESMTKDSGLWAKRPLPKNQLIYASEDVKYLIEAYLAVKAKMNKNLLEIVYFLSIFKCIQREIFFDFKLFLNKVVFTFLKKKKANQLHYFNYTHAYIKFKISEKLSPTQIQPPMKLLLKVERGKYDFRNDFDVFSKQCLGNIM